jgi:hypothetical protein
MVVKTTWIHSPKFDLTAIIGPSLVITAAVLIWGKSFVNTEVTPLWLWILLVLGIDVGHVYSSLFRTYFDKSEFSKRKLLYIFTPLISWLLGANLYYFFGAKLFWVVVAYMAIYHFVRQQYGFMMLYRRGEEKGLLSYRIDQTVIYLATLYPLLFWHTYTRKFQWFSEFNVFKINSTVPELLIKYVYLLVLIVFYVKEFRKWPEINVGKLLLLTTTALSWFTGIVLFNGDMTFTLVNTISHGVPYIALVWIFQYKKTKHQQKRFKFFQLKFVPIYLLCLVLIAYFEERIWDKVVWREHGAIFGSAIPNIDSKLLVFLIPLLTVPQVTHYVLDAFIWRVSPNRKESIREVIG